MAYVLHRKAALLAAQAAVYQLQKPRCDMNISEPNRKHVRSAAIAAAIALALGAGVQAQEPTRENANRPAADQSAEIARSDTGMQTLDQYLQSRTLRVSQLAGMELQARNGDNLGEVDDVLRSSTPGQDMRLVVQIGAIGAEERFVAVPFDEVQINADGDELYTSRTRDQLAAAPAVQLDRPGAGAATPAQRSAAEANRDAADRGAAPQAGAAASTQQRAAAGEQGLADLVGAEVIGSGGDQVGEIDDIVISMAGADSIRAVIQAGGIAGIGEKRVALPLGQVTIDRSAADDEPAVRVTMDADALQRLPEYEYEEQTTAL
jgi:sporulation protein YlmC with PRC-barrel domain